MKKKLNHKPEQEDKKASEKSLEKKQHKVAEQKEDYKELYVRTNADFQNYKRRVEKERLSWMHDAQASLLLTILPLLDDLHRAIEACNATDGEEKRQEWLDGLLLIQKKIAKTLEELGVKEIDGSGEFNPEHHEALVQVGSDSIPSGHIVDVMSKGYLFKDKVLRHAKVSVAK